MILSVSTDDLPFVVDFCSPKTGHAYRVITQYDIRQEHIIATLGVVDTKSELLEEVTESIEVRVRD